MKSAALGASTSEPEITNMSAHGVWLLLGQEELFMPFEQFPWFKDASIGAVLHVEQPSPGHLYWPDLDVDLSIDSIRNPERFPLVARNGA